MNLNPLYFATGGAHARTMAAMLTYTRAEKFRFADGEGGGPLDAPLWLPAGACDSTSTTTGRGKPLPAQSLTYRGGA